MYLIFLLITVIITLSLYFSYFPNKFTIKNCFIRVAIHKYFSFYYGTCMQLTVLRLWSRPSYTNKFFSIFSLVVTKSFLQRDNMFCILLRHYSRHARIAYNSKIEKHMWLKNKQTDSKTNKYHRQNTKLERMKRLYQ